MDDPEVEQQLVLTGMEVATRRKVPNPPDFMLMLDVKHEETGHEWRQEVRLSRNMFTQLVQLLDYAAMGESVDWRPSDGNDYLPPDGS